MRQQRRKNQARPVVSTGIQPLIAQWSDIGFDIEGNLILTTNIPLVILEAPNGPTVNGQPPTTAGVAGGSTAVYTYAAPVVAGDVVHFPPWSQSIRGLDGQWAAPIDWIVQAQPLNLALQPYVIDVSANGSAFVTIATDRAGFSGSGTPWGVDGIGNSIGWEVGTPDSVIIMEFPAGVNVGSVLRVPPNSTLVNGSPPIPFGPGVFLSH